MQWGHIKTLFIISFLVLDIYLLFQFIEKQQTENVAVLDAEDFSTEETLEAENITIEPDLDQLPRESAYINTAQRTFTEEEVAETNAFDNIAVTSVEDHLLVGQFENALTWDEDMNAEELKTMLGAYILNMDEYVFWDWNEELNALVFFQEKRGQTVYFNQNALLVFYMNDNDDITHYTQTMLGETEQQGELETINQSIQAIDTLYTQGVLSPNETVTDVRLGFFSRIEAEGNQVFAPTWKVTINEEEDYFVNAIENLVYPGAEQAFLTETFTNYRALLSALPSDNPLKEPMMIVIDQKLETENRSEIE